MRGLTVRQPWAWQIIHQAKDVENRSRNIAGSYRGPVAIQAAKVYDEPAMRDLPMHAPEWVTAPRVFWPGVILGVVDLVDVHDELDTERVVGALCSPWAARFLHHLVLANPRPLAHPIPWRGALGLWTVPADLEAAIWADIDGSER